MLNKKSGPFLIFAFLVSFSAFAQIRTNEAILQKSAKLQAAKEKVDFKNLLTLAKKNNWPMMRRSKTGALIVLKGVDRLGYPLYVTTDDVPSATTIGTDQLWSGGSLGINLSGSSSNMLGKIAMWDGGKVLGTHVELTGKISQGDGASTLEDHSTHVAGILAASGINPLARGMAYGLQQLLTYDFNSDISEMLGAGSNLLVSNHSYSTIAGWNHNDDDNRWEFNGRANDNEDYKFGNYDDDSQMWDSIAYNAPFYLIVKAAGNNRNQNGPAVGQPYWRPNSVGIMSPAGNRPNGISNNDSYDIIPTYGTAKNILTVGAVKPLTAAYTQPSDVVLTDFSSWGPTDDGRIKPDVVADGYAVLSTTATSNSSYGILSGTSMASPAAAGSLFLLQEYYSQLHSGSFMRAATLKGLIIHTANEAGPTDGPDYQYGWGLINMEKAATVIKSGNTDHRIYENTLTNVSPIFSLPITVSGNGPLVVTICWTDPKGDAISANELDNPTPNLVNDLDIRVKQGINTYMPWVLSPSVPSAAATKGDNTLDNVEKIEIPNPAPGQYTIEVTHKGTLARGSQAYSLIVSDYGVNFTAASAIDLAATGLVSPALTICPSSALVSIKIKNTGTTAKTNIPINTVIKNGNTTVATLTSTYPGTINAGQEVIYTYPTRFNAVGGNTYTFTTTVNFPGDQNNANNQRISTVVVSGGGTPPTDLRATECGGTVSLKATSNSDAQVFWYESANATDPITVGTDTSSSITSSNNTYYAAINDAPAKVGPTDKIAFTNGTYGNISGNFVKFTNSVPVTIESVKLFVRIAGQVRLTVADISNFNPADGSYNYVPISSTVIDAYTTTPNPGITSNNPADLGAVFYLNLPVPVAGDHAIIIDCLNGATLFYNNQIASNPYPFSIPNVFSITGNSSVTSGDPNQYQRFYLALYDLGIKLNGCASERSSVVADNCNGSSLNVLIGPNPGNGDFNLKMQLEESADLSISLMNILGQRVYTAKYPAFSGIFSQHINVSYLPGGIYLLRIEHGGNKYTGKLVIRNK